jgi:hypothetical protein
MNYMLNRWETFTRFLDDGRIYLTNYAAFGHAAVLTVMDTIKSNLVF